MIDLIVGAAAVVLGGVLGLVILVSGAKLRAAYRRGGRA